MYFVENIIDIFLLRNNILLTLLISWTSLFLLQKYYSVVGGGQKGQDKIFKNPTSYIPIQD